MDIRISSLVNMPLSRVAFALVIMMLEKAVSNSVVDNAGRLIGKPCVSANPLTKNAPTNERWLKSAQLFAFCFEKVRIKIFSAFCKFIYLWLKCISIATLKIP